MTQDLSTMDNTAAKAARQRSGGRDGRRAERSGPRTSDTRVPYIVRGIPPYDVMSEENLQRIEAAADRILWETGIEFRDDPVALDHWRRAERASRRDATAGLVKPHYRSRS